MSKKVDKIRLFVASPSDVVKERKLVDDVVKEINGTIGEKLDVMVDVRKWETNVHPDMGRPEGEIIKQIGEYDIFLGIMWKRFGTPTGEAESGTVEEFNLAYEMLKQNKLRHVLFYFSNKPFTPSLEEIPQVQKVLEFHKKLSKIALLGEYSSPENFAVIFRRHLFNIVNDIAASLKKPDQKLTPTAAEETVEDGEQISPPIENIASRKNSELCINPARSLFSSFQPKREGNKFVRLEVPTTPGIVNGEITESSIYLIRDPIRPYMIQIGETRSLRKSGKPDAIPELTDLNLDMLKEMYPFILGKGYKWIRMVFAELTTDPDILDYLSTNDPEPDVRLMAAQNPSGSNILRKRACLFCDPNFCDRRTIFKSPNKSSNKNINNSTRIIRNDFPYGPYFHYIAMPVEPVHSWEDIREEQLFDLNQTIKSFLLDEKEENGLHGSAGVFVGFNSTIRHLVLAKRTRSSAGASVAHVHKQVWGMAPASFNLANHLSAICDEYQKEGIDYLGEYLKTLEEKGFIVWQDKHVALYVPLGQISLHELQLMVKREGAHHFLDLSEAEVKSMSRAEFIAVQLYKRLGINSFNEVLLAEDFKTKTPCFRLIMAFITREVDLAVSELNHLYVVDKHPSDTVQAINEQWEYIEKQYQYKKDKCFAQFG